MNQKLSINPVPPYHLPQIHSSEILITSLPPASGDRLQTPQFGHQDERGLLGTPRPAGRGRRGTGRAGLASEFTVQPLQPEQPPATLRAPVTKDQVSSTHPTAKVQAML